MKLTKCLLEGHLAVEMHMGRPMGGGEDVFRLEVTDEASRFTFATISVSLEEFANLMSSRMAHGTADVRISSALGLHMENKTVFVPVEDASRCYSGSKEKRATALEGISLAAEKEAPGWVADREDSFNGHRLKGGKYAVIVRRWVARKDGGK